MYVAYTHVFGNVYWMLLCVDPCLVFVLHGGLFLLQCTLYTRLHFQAAVCTLLLSGGRILRHVL